MLIECSSYALYDVSPTYYPSRPNTHLQILFIFLLYLCFCWVLRALVWRELRPLRRDNIPSKKQRGHPRRFSVPFRGILSRFLAFIRRSFMCGFISLPIPLRYISPPLTSAQRQRKVCWLMVIWTDVETRLAGICTVLWRSRCVIIVPIGAKNDMRTRMEAK